MLFWSLFLLMDANAQVAEETDSSYLIHIINTNTLEGYEDEDGLDAKKLVGDVQLRQDTVFFSCDSAYLYKSINSFKAYGQIHIQQGDSLDIYADYLKYNGVSKMAYLYDNVLLDDKKTIITSDTLLYYLDNKKAILFNNVHVTDQKVDIYSDSLEYFTDRKRADLKKNVKLIDGEMEINADQMDYDFNTDIGRYAGNGKLTNKNSLLTSEKGKYIRKEDKVIFWEDVYVEDVDHTIDTDTLVYNTVTEFAEFNGETRIVNEGNVIECLSGTYDKKNDQINITGESFLENGPQTLNADSMFYDKASNTSFASGDVIWNDTAQNVSVNCDYLEYNEKDNHFKASQNLLFKQVIDGDTLYLTADTLKTIDRVISNSISMDSTQTNTAKIDSISIDSTQTNTAKIDSIELEEENDSLKTLTAYSNVMIYKSDFQSVCDSLIYDTRDSMFTFFKLPTVWFDNNQLTADTITLQTKNNEPTSFFLRKNAIIGSEEQEGLYNQIKGDTILGHFAEGKISQMDVNNNAESIYFAKDDENRFYGINQSKGKNIIVLIENEEVVKIKFYKQVSGEFHNVSKKDPYSYKFDTFKWNVEARPSSVNDLEVWIKKVAVENELKSKPDDDH